MFEDVSWEEHARKVNELESTIKVYEARALEAESRARAWEARHSVVQQRLNDTIDRVRSALYPTQIRERR